MGALKKHHCGPSRADSDWRVAKALKNFAGFIFVCSKSTVPDLNRGIFGMSGDYEDCVRHIRKGMPLFLFNYSNRRLYGVFEAASEGGYNLDPLAWGENNDHLKTWKHATVSKHPAQQVSKYPAQVRVCIRAEKPALEEESFRGILDYVEGQKFRLELSESQVQQLLCLFDAASQASKRELRAERNRSNRHFRAAGHRDPESPRSTGKSDSDSYSDCSSGGLNSCEDEWTDEAACGNGHYQHEDHEGVVSERLSQVALDGRQPYHKGHVEMHAASKDRVGAGYRNDQERAWKRSIQRAAPCWGPDSDNPMLSRLHEADPAVNSNSNHCIQTGVDQSLSLSRQDDVVTMPMISPSQMQFPFACRDNMYFIPVQTVQCQRRESAAFPGQSQRSKWSDQKRFSRGSMNSRKKPGFNQDRANKSKDTRYQNQQMVPENVPMQPPKLQFNQLLVQQDPLQLATLMSPLIMPPNSDALAFAQQQPGVRVGESGQGFDVANDVQGLPEELQHLLTQNSHFPILLMPRPAAGPQPITAHFVQTLHFEILEFARSTRPSAEVQLHVEAAIDCVRKGVKTLWPEADVEVCMDFHYSCFDMG
eukprot:c23509_g1_i3 orf=2032-3804(-)